MSNRFGLDDHYFSRELRQLADRAKDMEPEAMERALLRLADVAAPAAPVIVWKATAAQGDWAFFGTESMARAWAKVGGKVEPVEASKALTDEHVPAPSPLGLNGCGKPLCGLPSLGGGHHPLCPHHHD
jgi:hypothetical protein